MSKAPPRPSMSQARRARIFLQHDGICGISGQKIGPNDEWQIEHRIPWAISFDDSDDNLYPVLTDPHKAKTKNDVKTIAKAKRQSGIEGGQAARRAKRGFGLIQSRGFQKDGPKKQWPNRPFGKGDK